MGNHCPVCACGPTIVTVRQRECETIGNNDARRLQKNTQIRGIVLTSAIIAVIATVEAGRAETMRKG